MTHRQRLALIPAALPLVFLLPAGPAGAQITTDGTLGPAVSLSGPAVEIGAGLGRREGANLFHSFREFSVGNGQIVTFAGPDAIRNVVSRVTGGDISRIDGTPRSMVGQTDLFLVNPAGVVFGPGAQLQVPGAFHVSTADELRFSDGAVFSASNPAGSSFTTAAPEAFGFLGRAPGKIFVDRSMLRLAPSKTLSLVGGDITLDAGGAKGNTDKGIGAENGTVNLVSAAGPGTVHIADAAAEFERGGEIRVVQNVSLAGRNSFALVDVRGTEGSGTVRIRSGGLTVERAHIFADNLGDRIATGGITIQADRVSLIGARVTTDVRGAGRGGVISVSAKDLQVLDGSRIGTSVLTGYTGDAGEVRIVADRVLVRGIESEGNYYRSYINSTTAGGGSTFGGRVFIKAGLVELQPGSHITGQTTAAGNAGSVEIEAGRLLVTGSETPPTAAYDPQFTVAFIEAFALSTGNAGNIVIKADEVVLKGAVEIRSDAYGSGNGGTVKITAGRLTASSGNSLSPLITTSASFGLAGNIDITAKELLLDGKTDISSTSSGVEDAGNITIRATDTVSLTNGATISTDAESRNGGNIALSIGRLFNMQDSEVATSVRGGNGNGGNITIQPAPKTGIPDGRVFSAVLGKSRILAKASGGDGGNITIRAGQLIKSPNNIIDASSKTGVSGTIDISAPIANLTSALVVLPSGFLSTTPPLPTACAARGGQVRSSLQSGGQGGRIPDPGAPLLSNSDATGGARSASATTPRSAPNAGSQSKGVVSPLYAANLVSDPVATGCRGRSNLLVNSDSIRSQ